MRAATPQSGASAKSAADMDPGSTSKVYGFQEVNRRLWHLPVTADGEADWDAVRACLEESPEEGTTAVGRYFLSWLNPYVTLASRERMEEAHMPQPQRPHRALYCGALLSRAFRDVEVHNWRDAWRARVEAAVLGEDGAVCVPRVNALAVVQFRGESGVRGRLRWTGYVRSSETPHVLLGGVEWDGDGALPRYRLRYTGESEVVHDGVVHGERLFYQGRSGRARCTCEYLSDLVPLSVDNGGEAVPVQCRTPRAPSLLIALLRTFRPDLLAMLGPCVLGMVCELATPWLLQQFVLFLQSNKANTGVTRGVAVFIVFCAVMLIKPLVFNKQLHRGRRISSLFRAATLGVIFEKCFTVSPDALTHPEMSTGRILTMASADMENVKEFPKQVMFLWMAPILLTLYLVYLFTLVGWSVLAGVGVFVLSIPLQGVMVKVLERRESRLSSCTDQRLRRTNELLCGIRVVKAMGWESEFLTAIEDDARKDELRHRRALQICHTCLWACVFSAAPFMIAAVLTAYTLSGHVLDASVVLPVIAVISAVTFPIMMLPEAFASLAKFIVSTDRITMFLECDDSHIIVQDAERVFSADDAIRDGVAAPAAACFDRVTVLASVPTALPAYEPRHRGLLRILRRVHRAVRGRQCPVELQWTRAASALTSASPAATLPAMTAVSGAPDGGVEGQGGDTLYALQDRALLRDVRVCIPRGQLTVVVGATGSGKSVLVETLLGAFRFRGRLDVCPSIAYVPQQPWIMHGTVQANVTFFDDNRRVACGASAAGVAGSSRACSPLYTPRTNDVRPSSAAVQNVRLREAVRCCQLEADLNLFPKGLATEIGEKGVNLSGGQKARVSLARAVYADRDVYVLDDPLSALDAHVGRRVMEEVVMRALAGKTRVLVTHQLHVLPYADQVVVVRDGGVVFAGGYDVYAASAWKAYVENEEEVAGSKRRESIVEGAAEVNDFSPAGSPVAGEAPLMPLTHASSWRSSRAERSPSKEASRSRAKVRWIVSASRRGDTRSACLRERRRSGSADSSVDGGNSRSSSAPLSRHGSGKRSAAPVTLAGDAADAGEDSLMAAEEKECGHIPWRVYRRYMEAGGGVRVAVGLALCYLLREAVLTGVSVWLTLWSVQYFAGCSPHVSSCSFTWLSPSWGRSLCLSAISSFFHFARRASCRLHATLLYTMSAGTLTFFDRTPLGRVINRFSKDIYTLDDELPINVIPFMGIAGYAATSLLVTMYTSPLTVVVVTIAGYVFVRLLRFYATVVREVRRRGSVVQSPLFSLLEEVVQGRATIASYGKSHALFTEALRRLDLVYSCTYMEKAVTLWLAIRIEYIAAVMIIVVGLIGVVEKVVDASPVMSEARVGLISLSLTMCLDLSWALSSLMDFAAVVEACMNSAQRVCHYIDSVPQEALLLEPSDAYVAAVLAGRACDGGGAAAVPPAARARDVVVVDGSRSGSGREGNAEFGALRLEHVDMRYRPGLPLVLRDVSFAIAPGQKVGVVGRTGSGKSTLLLAFLRLVEVCGGRMFVCGRDAQSYTLPALRRLFSMIPQQPVLFDGTVRSNVDPFGDATDVEVRRALASVGFVSGAAHDVGEGGDTVSGAVEVPALDTVVQEGGSNFSVGQRQLLCLARALLKKSSAFLLMDEATANVDARLDQTVRRVVAEQFRDYTVVTIAHRLHTVASYDVILVMAHGRVVEFGSPRSLLEDRSSVFYGMVAQSSAVMSAIVGGAAAAGGGGGNRGDRTAVGGLSVEERQRRVEEVVLSFLKECK